MDGLDEVVDLVESQLRLRRANVSSSLRALWRTAIFIDCEATREVERRLFVHNKLEGYIAGQQLKKPVPLDQVK